MKSVDTSNRGLPSWYRPISVVAMVMMMAVLLLQFWQLARGIGYWKDLIPPSALLLLFLVPALQIKGLIGHILQFVSLGVLALAIVVLIRAVGY